MPKTRKRKVLSIPSRGSPYLCSSRVTRTSSSKSQLGTVEDIKEWEEARCPACIDHPHNAVLLLCSSYEKGCRPYMCDTSSRHSNCLDQFQKAGAQSSTTPAQDIVEQNSDSVLSEEISVDYADELSRERTPPRSILSQESRLKLKLSCPLCRGRVHGWVIVEPARKFMNAKTRSCASETCDFSGNYANLRKHARLKHPHVRPSEVDPQRRDEWIRLERERDFVLRLSELSDLRGDLRRALRSDTTNLRHGRSNGRTTRVRRFRTSLSAWI